MDMVQNLPSLWIINNNWMRLFVISGIIKVEVSVISLSLRPQLITLAKTLITGYHKNRIQLLFYGKYTKIIV